MRFEKRSPRPLSQRSRLLSLQPFHFVTFVKFAVAFYEVLFLLNFPERTPMRQNARQTIRTDEPTTGTSVKFSPLYSLRLAPLTG